MFPLCRGCAFSGFTTCLWSIALSGLAGIDDCPLVETMFVLSLSWHSFSRRNDDYPLVGPAKPRRGVKTTGRRWSGSGTPVTRAYHPKWNPEGVTDTSCSRLPHHSGLRPCLYSAALSGLGLIGCAHYAGVAPLRASPPACGLSPLRGLPYANIPCGACCLPTFPTYGRTGRTESPE